MKELSTEQKAKAYDEALERAKKYKLKEDLIITQDLFPELKESEDERIRKNCIHFLELQKQHHAATFEIEECIAWLEKQGDKEKDILEDAILDGNEDGLIAETIRYKNEKQGEQKPAWSEEDEELMKWSIINLTELKDRFGEEYGKVGDCIDWLKSLRLQSQWKPSAFHLECITDAISMYKDRGINAIGLKEILDELKKLREE